MGESLFSLTFGQGLPFSRTEFFYHPTGLDTDFDSELQVDQSWQMAAKVRMKNAYLNLALQQASWNVSLHLFNVVPSLLRSTADEHGTRWY